VFGSLQYLPARQPDTDRFRLWEVAGGAHADTYFFSASPFDSGALAVDELAALLAKSDGSGLPVEVPINSGPQMHYVLQRAFDACDRWVRGAVAAPSAPRLTADDNGQMQTDANGVARGGVRTPWVDAPVEILSGLGQPGFMMDLFGVTRPLPADALAAIYPGGRNEFVDRFDAATRATVEAGFVLAVDAAEIEGLGRAGWERVSSR
jgi:hypothetical protein